MFNSVKCFRIFFVLLLYWSNSLGVINLVMRVSAVNDRIAFGRELKSCEINEFVKVRDEAKKLVGQNGMSIFIVHDPCLPREKSMDTGLGNLATKEAKDFFEYMKTYLGFNTVEVLPSGEVAPFKGAYCAYAGTALSLGNHQINPYLLTTSQFEKILKPKEYNQIVEANKADNLGEWHANFKNVMNDDSAQDNALKIAYKRFQKLPQNSKLKTGYETFVSQNNDWLEPKGIFKVLYKNYKTHNFDNWPDEIDKNLYNPDFDNEKRKTRINALNKEYSEEIDFYKFKQFLADSHLAIARENLNNMGVELKGDCEIGFSADEKWAYPKAFKKGSFIGMKEWGLPALDYDSITNPDSDAAKLLKRKVQLCAQRYDSIRFDVGWAYVNPKIFPADGKPYTKYLGDTVLNFIENAVREVKGQDYDLHNLIYEFEGGDIFQNNGELLPPVKNRVKVFGTTYMHDTWGSNDAFLKRNWSPDEFVVGVGNHDPQPLRQIANNVRDLTVPDTQFHKEQAIMPLARILKLDPNNLQNPVEFAKAKWAEPMMAKNNQMFYMDVFGREERFDMQGLNHQFPERIYAYKIPENYRELYHNAVQEGYGFNIMDSLEKVFKAKNLDASHPELYAQIVKFRDILNDKNVANVVEKTSKKSFAKPIAIIGGTLLAVLAGVGIIKSNKKSSKIQANQNPSAQNSAKGFDNFVSMDKFIKA